MSEEHLTPDDILFVGRGATTIAWYRSALPAEYLGCDFVGVVEDGEGDWINLSGLDYNPDWTDYKVVFVQQPDSPAWEKEIKRAQAAGVKVVFEIDDYIPGVRHEPDHPKKDRFPKYYVDALERCMGMCDAIVTSTEFLAEKFSRLAPTYVCLNSLDLRRYNYTRPERDIINIGWAGGVAHKTIMNEWLVAVDAILSEYDHVGFVSIGEKFERYREKHAHKWMTLPFGRIENYPAAMMMFDIALAPAGNSAFFKGKSDLRFLEAAALRIPVIGEPNVYHTIDHGNTGFHATEPAEVYAFLKALVESENARRGIGGNARAYVERERNIETAVQQWIDVIEAVT